MSATSGPDPLDPALEPFHRPDRSLVLTGISRSGTSLLCALVNALPNAVCLNEVLPSEPSALLTALARTRKDLLRGRPVPNKFDVEDGAPTTNTLGVGVVREKRRVEKPLDDELLLASKRNLPYLLHIEQLLALELPVVALLRDPVYALGSWGGEQARGAGIPGARIGPDHQHPHWDALALTRPDPIERRAEAWQLCAERLWAVRERVIVLRYEDLCADPVGVLDDIAARFGLPLPPSLPVAVRPAQNDDRRYPDIPRVRAAVAKLCPARFEFGYD